MTPPPAEPPWVAEERSKAARLKAEFAEHFGVRRIKWSGHNLSRMLRATGERPERVDEMRGILIALGLHDRRWIGTGGVFDHGEMWGRGRVPLMLTGHPYDLSDEERERLAILARFSGLKVSVDDRPSFYGWGTHHVRIELAEVRRPFLPPPSTYKTRAAARSAREAFREAFGGPRR